jgi:septum formation protein
MTPLNDAEIRWYISTGEPFDKAGGYGAQGLASRFIETIEGSYSNVVGLPIASLCALLKQLGCDILNT